MNDPAAPADAPAPAPVAPPAPPPPAAWPVWVRFADVAVGLMVVAAAFLAAGFPARNSDAFPHFAAGRLIAEGKYPFGTDPFAQDPGKPWANTSWLYDLGSYLLLKAAPDGTAVVVAKALAFAGMAVLILLFRRSGEPGWPYWLLAALAVAASATHAGLRPLVGTGLFLAATLLILFRLEWKPGSWRNPVLLAVLFWVWSGVDGWFVLGPLAVLAALAGEFIQGRGAADPDSPPLPTKDLAKALGLGVLACTLTPNHVHAWRLPAELAVTFTASDAVKADPMYAVAFRSPLAAGYLDNPLLGQNAGGFAFVALLGLSLVLVFAGVVVFKLRAAYLILWVLAALLAARQYRLILPFAAVAAPLAAAAAAAAVARIKLGPADRPGTRLVLLASGIGRVLGLAGGLLLAAAGFAGWLQPDTGTLGVGYRFGPKLEPDAAMARTAKLLQDWRTTERMPAGYRGMHLSPQFGDLLTWFAPAEPPFVTTRYSQHPDVLEDVGKANRLARPRSAEDADPAAGLADLLDKHKAQYLVFAPTTGMPIDPPLQVIVGLTGPGGGYALWHADGRSAVLGRLTGPGTEPGASDRLAFDPVRLAFDPDTPPLPEPPLPARPAPPREWVQVFTDPPPAPVPPDAADAVVWTALAEAAYRNQLLTLRNSVSVSAAIAGSAPTGLIQAFGFPAPPATDPVVGLRLLAARAARRAVAANPDAPDGYRATAVAFAHEANGPPPLPGTPPQEARGVFVAFARGYLDRRPPETASQAAADEAVQYTRALAGSFQQMGMSDQVHDMLKRAAEYQRRAFRPDPEAAKREQDQIQANVKRAADDRAARYDAYAQQSGPLTNPTERVQLAVGLGLIDKAAEEYAAARQAGTATPQTAVTLAAALLRAGRLPEAAEALQAAGEALQAAGEPTPQTAATAAEWQAQRVWLMRMVGDYAQAGEAVEKAAPPPLNAFGRQLVALAVASPEAWAAVTTGGTHGGLGGPFGLLIAVELANTNRLPAAQAVSLWVQSADFYLDRGRLLLLEGKVREAKERFKQALRPDREGPELPAFVRQRGSAELYLRLIEQAERGAGR